MDSRGRVSDTDTCTRRGPMLLTGTRFRWTTACFFLPIAIRISLVDALNLQPVTIDRESVAYAPGRTRTVPAARRRPRELSAHAYLVVWCSELKITNSTRCCLAAFTYPWVAAATAP